MKTKYIVNRLLTLLACLMATAAFADENVRGYYRPDGNYVQPYTRTEPDQSRSNNRSAEQEQDNQRRENAYPGNPYASHPGESTYGSNGGGTYE